MMMNMNKAFIDRFFRPVDKMVWDLMSGKIGYKGGEGIVTIELNDLTDDKTEAPNAQVVINPFDEFGMEVPAFAQSVPVETISLGDMIFSSSSNKILGWVVKKNEKSFKLMKQDGTRSDWSPPKVQMLGFDSGVMVLRSLLNMLPGGSDGLGNMQSMIMPLMAMGMLGDSEGNGSFDLKSIMPMMLMSQINNTSTDSTNMMGNMMQMMMMAQLFKGGNSPFNSLPSSNNSQTYFDKHGRR